MYISFRPYFSFSLHRLPELYFRYLIFLRRSSLSHPPFEKVLIANRGEIACRIIHSCRSMGIKTVAIYSTIDSQALHVRLADESWCIGPPSIASSYLNMHSILNAALSTKSQAVHPGYGFLSENYRFVDLLESNGIVFIGPSSKAIQSMGDKIQSKFIARNAKVNTIPGFLGVVSDITHAFEIANEIGFPIMIKASSGGGGKGMRITYDEHQLKENFSLSQTEAQSSFGDDRLLIEKYIPDSRHIEIQILSDKFGNTISLNERECSIQRRNQKIIEEAPSSFLNANLRSLMSDQAISLAKSVNYSSAGTVEFLIDESQMFYFLEMNTRLQVEHPVTEYTTGFDIVKEMIHIAKGERLTISQSEVPLLGWSIESRIYAEDPINFLPSIGTINQQILPDLDSQFIRFDSGVSIGSEITIHYDPLLLKLISHGKNREEAISNMIYALDHYVLMGVKTNIPFIYSVLTNPRFISGQTNTNFIRGEYPNGFEGIQLVDKDKHVLDICAMLIFIIRDSTYNTSFSNIFPYLTNQNTSELYGSKDSFEQSTIIERKSDTLFTYHNTLEQLTEVVINWSNPRNKIEFRIGDNNYAFQFINCNHEGVSICFKGDIHECSVKTPDQYLCLPYIKERSEDPDPFSLCAPMSGKVHDILVKNGDIVNKGTSLMIIEAMKMHNVLISPIDSKIKLIHVDIDASVMDGDCLLEFSE